MACSSLKYYEANGGRASDDIFVTWVMQHCLFSAQTALLETLDNFTSPILGRILKFILFPFCKPYKKPSDELEHKLSMSLLSNCQTREVFKSMCYVPDDYNDLIGRVEIAFKAALETNPIKHKIQKAVRKHQLPKDNISEIAAKALEIGIIDNMELDKLLLSLKLSNEVIQVDEFGPFELGPKNAHPTWK